MSSRWELIELGRAVEFLSGGTPSKAEPDYWGGEIPWISAASLHSEAVVTSERRVTDAAIGNGTRLAPVGSTLILVRGMSLLEEIRAGRVLRPVAFNQDVKALVPHEGTLYPPFLLYLVLANRRVLLSKVHQAGHGTGVLATEHLKSLSVAVPAIEEQRRIAGVIGALDDLAEADNALATTSEVLAQALVDRSGSSVPLADCASERRDPVRPVGACDHYSLPAFDDGFLPARCDGSTIKSGKNVVAGPSVLVSRLNPHIPRVWMAYPEPGVLSVASTEFVVVEAQGVPAEWVWAACSSPGFVAAMQQRVTGTTGSHQRVDKAALMTIPVADPHGVPETTVNAVTQLVRHAHELRLEAVQLRRTRDELLPLLMSGRVRVGEVSGGEDS